MTLLRTLPFRLVLHSSYLVLVLSPRNVRACGCPRMICRTRPHSSSWSSPPRLLLRDIHSKLLAEYICKGGCAPSLSQVNVGASGGISSQDGDSQQQEADPLSIPQLNCLIEASFVRYESSASNAAVPTIPLQHRIIVSPSTNRMAYPTDTQPLAALPGPQTYVCGLASS